MILDLYWAAGHPRAVEENHSFGNASLIQVKEFC